MQLCVVNGSLRGGRGASGKILAAIEKGFVRGGGSVRILNLSEMKIESCRACSHCQTSKTYRCIYENRDNVSDIMNAIREADIVLYATPVYVFGMSSLLKRLLERFYSAAPVDDLLITKSGIFFHASDQALMGKPVVSLVVSDNVENITVQNAKSYFENYSKFMDAKALAHLERRSASVWLSSLTQSQTRMGTKANQILEAFEEIGNELSVNMSVSRRSKRQSEMKLIRIPSFVKAVWQLPAIRPKVKQEMNRIAHDYFLP
jgi:multimeric flavodoxin WrbA